MGEDNRKRLTEPVPWIVFIWAVGIASALFLGSFTQSVKESEARASADKIVSDKQTEILVQLSQIQTDLKYLIKSSQ